MSFVTSISPTDRIEHQLDAFDAQHPMSNPQGDWARDVSRNMFLRILRPEARKNEPGDPDAIREVDYHLRCRGEDYVIATRYVDITELGTFPGSRIHECGDDGAKIIYSFYVWHIQEFHKEIKSTTSNDLSVPLKAFCEAMYASCGGLFSFASASRSNQPRRIIVKLSTQVGENHARA